MLACRLVLTIALLSALPASAALAGEVRFTNGPQEFAGTQYYWLAEWKLVVTLPADTASGDRLEVLFGTKGATRRPMYFDYAGKTGSLAHHGKKAFEWIAVPVGPLAPGRQITLYGKGREAVAFLAGVRVTGQAKAPPKVKPIRVAHISAGSNGSASGEGRAVWSELGGFELTDETRRLWDPAPAEPDWSRAQRSAKYAGIALDKVQRWLHERILPIRDAKSGLFRATGAVWNYRDTAADCYPFYVWAAYYTDKKTLDTVMRDALAAEQKLCNYVGRLPVPYNMDAGKKLPGSHDSMIFGASEYVKDGLCPIVEITGPKSPWFARMRGIVDDIFAHARVETPYGTIPSRNVEVHGELLQMLPRLYRVTGEKKYLDWAHRLADHYLLRGKYVPSRLSDHGCEIIGGLGLLFAIDCKADPAKAKAYRPHLEHMFDEILKRGTNSDGVIVGSIQPKPGPHDKVRLRDGWGYDLVGFLDYDLALGTRRYWAAARRPMTNLLKPRYKHFHWDHGSRDNIADSVEGGLYLLRRLPTPAGFVWADREIATCLVDHVKPDRLWGTHKLEANTVRTVLIHTMLHTRNTLVRPWQQGLQLGAAPCGSGICVYLQSDKPYEGRLVFDIPRHRLTMGFSQDWPRMNAVPEWFTVEPDEKHTYQVTNADTGETKTLTGQALHEGLPIRLEAGKPMRLIVKPDSGKNKTIR